MLVEAKQYMFPRQRRGGSKVITKTEITEIFAKKVEKRGKGQNRRITVTCAILQKVFNTSTVGLNLLK